MSLAETAPLKALGVARYVQGDQRTYTVGPFLGDDGQPLRFADDTVEVRVQREPGAALFVKHSATNPTTAAQNGISSDGRGNVRYTLFERDFPLIRSELRLQVEVRRTFNDSAGSPKKPYTVTLGVGEIIVQPKLS